MTNTNASRLDHIDAKAAYLLPMRLFIGLGWLRAGVEKLLDPNWAGGDSLHAFLTEQMAGGDVYFPFYAQFIHQVFLPNAAALAWIVLIGQLLVGAAIASGTLTNAALLGGLFMNLNFILAGRVDPSAFYVVIQLALFFGNAGAVVGVDAWLSRRVPSLFAAAQTEPYRPTAAERQLLRGAALLAAIAALLAVPFIREFGPQSVTDPAMLLFILGGVAALGSFLRSVAGPSRYAATPATGRQPQPSRPLD